MPPKSLMAVALVVVFIGCRDGPAILDVPVESHAPVEVQSRARADVFVAVQQMLEDPLVLEIVEALGDRSVASRFDGLRDEIDRQTVSRDVLATRRTLMATRDLFVSDSEETDMVLQDVLRLVLDDARMMIEGDVELANPAEADGDRVRSKEMVKH
jgi:hypothetical protein